MALVGLLAGRLWVVPLAAICWPLLLAVTGVTSAPVDLVIGAALAAANTAVGVGLHQATRVLAKPMLGAVRSHLRRRSSG